MSATMEPELAARSASAADHVVNVVEEAVSGLKPEAGHPHEVGIRERQRHAQSPAVRLLYVASLTGQNLPRALAVFPVLH